MTAAEVAAADLSATVGGASNVLVLVPSLDHNESDACSRLLAVAPPAETIALSVTVTQSPDDRLEAWRSNVGAELPAKMGIVDVGGTSRSAAAAVVAVPESVGEDIRIETVSSPADLTNLGIRVSTYLSEAAGRDEQVVMCFHSLTPLLQYVDLQRLFRFLHVLTGRVAAVDGLAHYHMDPTAHDEQTLNTLKTLFDAVVEFEDDGTWVVARR